MPLIPNESIISKILRADSHIQIIHCVFSTYWLATVLESKYENEKWKMGGSLARFGENSTLVTFKVIARILKVC